MLHADLRAKTLDPKEENSRRLHPPTWPSQPLATQHLPDESWGATPSQDVFLLDNSLPAPLLLDLLEDEMGLPKHGGFLSSEGSSCKSGLGKDPGENVIQQLTVNVALSESAPKLTLELRHSLDSSVIPERSLVPTCQWEGEKFQSGAEEDQRKFTPAPVGSKPRASSSFQPVPVPADVSERMGATKAILTSRAKTN
ncbi:hypothetical protein E2320_007300 [Naja naja]|nr:hypothetical protein E2320_007300 [Naja naja]